MDTNFILSRAKDITKSLSGAVGLSTSPEQKEVNSLHQEIQMLSGIKKQHFRGLFSEEAWNLFKKLNLSILNKVAQLFCQAGELFEHSDQDHLALIEFKNAQTILQFVEDQDYNYSLERIHLIDDIAVKINYRDENAIDLLDM